MELPARPLHVHARLQGAARRPHHARQPGLAARGHPARVQCHLRGGGALQAGRRPLPQCADAVGVGAERRRGDADQLRPHGGQAAGGAAPGAEGVRRLLLQ